MTLRLTRGRLPVGTTHGGIRDAVHHPGEDRELGTVQPVEPVRLRPVAVPVSHRMRADHAQPGGCQPGHQDTFHCSPAPGRPGHAASPRRNPETPVCRAGHRQPRERDQAGGRARRAWPVAHMPERAHPPGKQPQMPVREHLLKTGHVGIAGIKFCANHRIARGQSRADQGHAPRVERRNGQLLPGHLSHTSGIPSPSRPIFPSCRTGTPAGRPQSVDLGKLGMKRSLPVEGRASRWADEIAHKDGKAPVRHFGGSCLAVDCSMRWFDHLSDISDRRCKPFLSGRTSCLRRLRNLASALP
jgi:hypothetical protein